MKKVCIIGLGIIGGSLGMAIRRKKLAKVIGLTRKAAKIKQAKKMRAVDMATTNPKEAVKDADIIFVCYPIHLIIPELKKIVKFAKPGAIITDVGSTKEEIVGKAEKLMRKGVHFVGGHPMAGKEKVGLGVAEADLFKGKYWILTKTGKTDAKAFNTLKAFLKKLGIKIMVLPSYTHDRIVAGISHSLISVAAALVNAVGDSGAIKKFMLALAASGFRDTTRIASGDPMLAVDMFTTNKKSVLRGLEAFRKSLGKIEKAIKGNKISLVRKELTKAKKLRDSIYK